MEWFHNYLPQPILWQFGFITIRWYGLMVASGLFLAILIVAKLAKKRGKNPDDVYSLALWLAIFGVIGARLYDVFIIDLNYFFYHPQDIIKIWQGGLAIHGAIIGGAITLIVWCKNKKEKFLDWLDLAAYGLPIGQAIGRFGNFFNQELFGWPTDWPWGIHIAINNRPEKFIDYSYFQPAFLYESILNLSLFLLLFFLIRKKTRPAGFLVAVYLTGYGLIRFVMEFIRIDETAMIGDFRWPQIFSLIVCVGGLGWLYFLTRKKV